MSLRPRSLATVRLLAALAVLLPLLATSATAPLRAAQKEGKFKLLFSDRPDDPKPSEIPPPLRPNVLQKLYVYVRNANPNEEKVVVEVQAGGAAVPNGTKEVPAKGNGTTLVEFAPPAEKPAEKAPADKGPADKAAGEKGKAAKDEPPLAEVKGRLRIRLLDEAKKVELDTADLETARASDYVKFEKATFDPRPQAGRANRLTVELTATQNFAGPPCRVDLDLRPDRIPDLVEKQRKEGTRGGYLYRAGGTLTLTADNLQLRDTTSPRDGLLYLTIDGYERAFTVQMTFPRDGGVRTTAETLQRPLLRLKAPLFANPDAPYPVQLEVDNAPRGAVAELGLDKDGGGFKAEQGELVTLPDDRSQKLFVGFGAPKGALLLRPELSDWKAELDAKGIDGRRSVRLRLLDAKGKPEEVIDIARGPSEVTEAITAVVRLNSNEPYGVRFVGFPKKSEPPLKLVKGEPLPLKATSDDPRDDVKEVRFYLGKPGPDGKKPANAPEVVGKLVPDPDRPERGEWVASLPAPTMTKGTLEVTAVFVNQSNLSASETITIELVEAGAAGKGAGAGKTSIEGVVTEGDRPQPNVPVALRDVQGNVKDTKTTNDKGQFVFENLAPGTYRVAAAKVGSNTKGETAVGVAEGEKKKVEVKLLR
jgi:hypothetical protein